MGQNNFVMKRIHKGTVVFFLLDTVIFFLLSTVVFSQDIREETEKYIRNLPVEKKVHLLLDSAKRYTDTDLSKSLIFGDMALQNLNNSISDSLKTEVYFQLFITNHMSGNYAKALEYVSAQQELLKKDPGKNEIAIAASFANLGEIYRSTRDYDNAISNLSKSEELYAAIGGVRGEIGLSRVYERYAAVYFEICENRKQRDALNKAEEYALKSIEISNKYKLNTRIISNYNILGAVELSRKNTDKALVYLLNALEASRADSSYYNRINIEINVAQGYFDLKDYNRAIEYAQTSYAEAKRRGITVYAQMASKILHEAYYATGDYKTAYNFLLEYKTSDDLMRSEELKRTISSFEQKDLSEKKENEIRLQKEKYTLLISAGVILVLFIVSGFTLRQRHLKKINIKLKESGKIISSQKTELEELNATQNKFFSLLSHDLRNPFNGILGFLSLLRRDYDTLTEEERKQFIGYVDTSANQVYNLLEKLLAVSRLQDGRYKFRLESVEMNSVVSEVLQLQNSNALNKKITIEDKTEADIKVYADRNSLETILRNLTDNALKFTPAGGKVTITSEAKGGKVYIRVTDTGVGIDHSEIDNLFRLDKKVISKGTNEESGTGLGLYVCKEMAEKMNGRIEVESSVGKGTTFTLILPAE